MANDASTAPCPYCRQTISVAAVRQHEQCPACGHRIFFLPRQQLYPHVLLTPSQAQAAFKVHQFLKQTNHQFTEKDFINLYRQLKRKTGQSPTLEQVFDILRCELTPTQTPNAVGPSGPLVIDHQLRNAVAQEMGFTAGDSTTQTPAIDQTQPDPAATGATVQPTLIDEVGYIIEDAGYPVEQFAKYHTELGQRLKRKPKIMEVFLHLIRLTTETDHNYDRTEETYQKLAKLLFDHGKPAHKMQRLAFRMRLKSLQRQGVKEVVIRSFCDDCPAGSSQPMPICEAIQSMPLPHAHCPKDKHEKQHWCRCDYECVEKDQSFQAMTEQITGSFLNYLAQVDPDDDQPMHG